MMKKLMLQSKERQAMKMKPMQLVGGLLMLSLASSAFGQTPPKKQASFQEALKSAITSTNASEMATRYGSLSGYTINTAEDLQGAYDALVGLENQVADEELMRQTALPVAMLIEKASSPTLSEKVADLLDKENRNIPLNYNGSAATSLKPEKAVKEGVRTARLMALIQAAGAGKNRAALPTLRNMQGKGGLAGEAAGDALGRIGDSQDLDALIGKIKRNPSARIDLSSFGSVVIDRIMQEVDSPNVSEAEKSALIPRLKQAAGSRSRSNESKRLLVSKYAALLRHKNPDVVETAALMIPAYIQPQDVDIAHQMIRDQNKSVRFAGLQALDRIWDGRSTAKVIELLKNDKDDDVRARAASLLGQRRVRSAESAIRQALKDSSGHVRSSAAGALDILSGESDRRLQENLRKRNQAPQ